jgi:hypothetical protein
MKLKHLFMPLAGLALISLASPSYAYDYKFQTGSACKPQEGTQVGDFIYPLGAIFNLSTSPRIVICPIVRDSVSEALLDIGVTVQSNGVNNLYCTFFSYDTNGGLISPSITKFTGERTPTKLYFTVPAGQTARDGNYEIRCTLPQSSYVFNYISGEDAPTDNGF